MNSIHFARRNSVIVARRFASASPAVPKAPLPEVYQNQTFKKAFLEDPGCYPIIVIMGFITCIVVGMSAHQIVSLKDLRFSTKARQSEIQNWGHKHDDSVASRWARGPMILRGAEYRSTWREGLGVDHEEWLKQKAAKDAAEYR